MIAAVRTQLARLSLRSKLVGLYLLFGILPVMLLALNAVFVLYDCCFTRVMRTVMRRYRKLFLND